MSWIPKKLPELREKNLKRSEEDLELKNKKIEHSFGSLRKFIIKFDNT